MNNTDYKAIIIGCSLGGKDAVTTIIRNLKNNVIPVIVVQHLAADSECYLAPYLNDIVDGPVIEILNNSPIKSGTIHIAPANYHLLIGEDKTFYLSVDEPYNFSRPSIDVSFESAAQVFENQLIGVVLSGANSDGSKGLKKIKDNGGLTIVQDPDTAEARFMPQSAIDKVAPDHILALDKIGELIEKFSEKEKITNNLDN